MNILLIGGTSSLINHLILKLRKEGHRVFLLTGSKYKKNKYNYEQRNENVHWY